MLRRNNRLIPFFLLLSIVFGILFVISCAKKPPKVVTPPIKAKEFLSGVVVLSSVEDELKSRILNDFAEIKGIKFIFGSRIDQLLLQKGLAREILFNINSIYDYRGLTQLDYFFVFGKEKEHLIVQMVDFRRRELSYLNVTKWIEAEGNILLYPDFEFLYVNSLTPGLSVYLDYKYIGVTPLLVRAREGVFQLTLAAQGQTFLDQSLKLPQENNIFYDKDVDLQQPQDPMEMTNEERRGMTFLATLWGLIISSGIIIPLILLL